MKSSSYHHLSCEQRYTIACLHGRGESISFIAQTIGVHKSTISRELKRNVSLQGYRYTYAHQYALSRRSQRRSTKFTPQMQELVIKQIKEDKWSPEQISGRARLMGREMVGKTTIYRFLHRDKESGGELYKYTRHALSHRRRRLKHTTPTLWQKRKSITERPDIINKQERIGDFEMDLIIGAVDREAILTLTDRKTGFSILQPLPQGKKAQALSQVVCKRLSYLKRSGKLHSITTDNGTEFTDFKRIEKRLKIPVYFARPYRSTDKPHIENFNGLVRQYLPKGKSFRGITEQQIKEIERELNNRPKKKLAYKTPFEAFILNL